jgi:hypothetical protein
MKRNARVTVLTATESFVLRDSLREEYLTVRGKFLEEVWLDMYMDDQAGEWPPNRATKDVATHCPNIKQFTSSECHSEEALIQIAAGCSNLEKLVLGGGPYTDATLLAFATNCHFLKEISLRGYKKVSEAAIITLVESSPLLERLHVESHKSPLTDLYLLKLAAACPKLTNLDLHNVRMTDAGIYALAEHCPLLQELYCEDSRVKFKGPVRPVRFQSLRKLSMYRTLTNDAGFDMFLRCCPTVQVLEFFDLGKVTPAAFEQVAVHCPNIRKLSDKCGSHVTDAALLRIAALCHDLRFLNAARSAATSVGLDAIARGCPLLENLDVMELEGITDDLLVNFTQYCAGLRSISLDGCTLISDRGVRALLQGCPLLQNIGIDGCRGVTKETRALVRQRRKELMQTRMGERDDE